MTQRPEVISFAGGLPEVVHRDVARINQIWRGCREHYGNNGSWLFGQFGILDAMYPPAALRFHTYQIEAAPAVREYVDAALGHPAVAEWIAAGKAETGVIQAFEK